MIKSGRIVLDSSVDTIINLAQRTFRLVKAPKELINKIEKLPIITNAHNHAAIFTFQTKEYEKLTKLITGENFYNFYVEKPSLEDAFRDYYE